MDRPSADLLDADVAGLRRLARSLVRDAASADDLAQEAWLVALRRGVTAPLRWLGGVVRFKAREARRAHVRRERREEMAARPDAVTETPLDHVARLDECRRAVDLLRGLPDPYRETLTLHLLGDRPLAQIARDRGVPTATVRTHHARGLALLRERMDEAHDGDRRRWRALLLPLAGAPVAALAVGVPLLAMAAVVAGVVFVAHLTTRQASTPAPQEGPHASGGLAPGEAPPVLVGGRPAPGARPAPAPESAPGSVETIVTGRVVPPDDVRPEKLFVYAVRKDRPREDPDEQQMVAPVSEDGFFGLPVERLQDVWILTTFDPELGLRRAWIDGAKVVPGVPLLLRPVRGPALHLTAVDGNGTRLPIARLEVVPADMAAARRWPGPEDPATGQVGTLAPFVTSIGPEGTVVNLAYEHPILATVTVDGYGAWVRVLKPVEQRVQAVLEPSATIVMRLTGDVAPGDDVSVTALRVRPDGTLASVGERRGFPRGGAIEVRPDGTLVIVRVDERRGFPRDGAIEARLEDDIGPGTYELQVKSARHRAVEPRRVLVHRAREVVESSAILEARDDVGHLRVRLRAAAGGELQTGERGTVMLHRHRHDASAWRLETTTPPDEFLLENLESGTYDVLWVLESPARAALLRGVVVRPGETVERDVAAEAGVWVRMPSVADATGGSSARVVGADGKSFPLYLDGDKNFNLSDGKPPPSAGELFGPYPASAVPLTLRLAVAGRELTLPLPTVER